MNLSLVSLNNMSRENAIEVFLQCCHSRRWAQSLADARPYDSKSQLLGMAKDYWLEASEEDKLEAFSGHPKIGDIEAIKDRFSRYTRAEQGQVLDTSMDVIYQFKELNLAYEARFGFIFIVSAAGKSAEEMLDMLKMRMENSREQEIANGAAEQDKITWLRLSQLVESEGR